jgi:hypothetical protein
MFGFHWFVLFKESLTGCLSRFASQFSSSFLEILDASNVKMPQNFTSCV